MDKNSLIFVDLLKRIQKVRVKIVKELKKEDTEKPIPVVKIGDDEYSNENELLEAYGFGAITRRQYEKALAELKVSKQNPKSEMLMQELKVLDNFIWNLSQDKTEEQEREARNSKNAY